MSIPVGLKYKAACQNWLTSNSITCFGWDLVRYMTPYYLSTFKKTHHINTSKNMSSAKIWHTLVGPLTKRICFQDLNCNFCIQIMFSWVCLYILFIKKAFMISIFHWKFQKYNVNTFWNPKVKSVNLECSQFFMSSVYYITSGGLHGLQTLFLKKIIYSEFNFYFTF